ncbi:MAG: hypothetical protein ACYDA4_07340 [Ignavibacteriaceae bacterium]
MLSDFEKEIVSILREEKKLVFTEKLQLIKTTKSAILLLFPFLILSLQIAPKAPALYLLLPFVISCLAFTLIAGQSSMNIMIEYIARIDQLICDYVKTDLPLMQKNVGQNLANWKFRLSKKSKHYTPNLYYFVGISMLFVVLPIYGYSIIKGNQYLLKNKFYWWNCVYDFLSGAFLIVVIWVFALYGKYFNEIRITALDEMLGKFVNQKKFNND